MSDLSILFWNMHKKDLSETLLQILEQHAPTVVLLCEYGGSEGQLLTTVNRKSIRYRMDDSLGVSRMIALTTLRKSGLKRLRDEDRYSFWRVGNGQNRITLCGLHLHSGPNHDQKVRNQLLPRIRPDLATVENREGHDRTVLIGDMNLNPFDDMLMSSEGLHAISSLNEAKRGSRQVLRQERPYFYNPMWSHLGDRPIEPSGTYFWEKGSAMGYGWNMLDQTLFRPSVMDLYEDFEVEILTHAGDNSLVDVRGRPDSKSASDHLPIRIHFFEKASP